MIKISPKARADMEIDEFNKRQKKSSGLEKGDSDNLDNSPMKKFLEASDKNKKDEQRKKKIKKERPYGGYESSSERIYQIYQNPLHDGDDIHIDTHTNKELHDSYDPYNREETIYEERATRSIDRDFEK